MVVEVENRCVCVEVLYVCMSSIDILMLGKKKGDWLGWLSSHGYLMEGVNG
jgi:hypothetical protein